MEERIEQLIVEAQMLELRLREQFRQFTWDAVDPALDRLARVVWRANGRAARRIGTYFEFNGPFAPL